MAIQYNHALANGVTGSINALKFMSLLNKIPNDPTFSDKGESIVVKYGKNKATFRKEKSALSMYRDAIIKADLEYTPTDSSFFDGLKIMNFQDHKNKYSGLFIEFDKMYIVNANDIAEYILPKGLPDVWIPREGVLLLQKLHEIESDIEINIGSSFLTAHTEHLTVAIKAKIAKEYPVGTIKKVLKTKREPECTFEVPTEIKDSLARIKISASINARRQPVMKLEANDNVLKLSTVDSIDTVEEYISIKDAIPDFEAVVSIASMSTLYENSNGTFDIIRDADGLSIGTHTDNMHYIMVIK